MKISIVTAALNNRGGIVETLDSLLMQVHQDWEYIIIDGASTDGTVDFLRSCSTRFGDKVKWISQPDGGIYHAMNKGIALASGDAVGFLGGGDTFVDELSLKNIADAMERTGADAVYGDLMYVSHGHKDKACRYWRGSQYEPGIFNSGWQPAHPTFFARRSCFDRYGVFDTDLEISADFDLMFRFLEKFRISSRYIPCTLVRMLSGGESNSSLRKICLAHRNIYRSFRKYGYNVPPLYSLRRTLPKILNMLETYIQS